MLNYENDKTEFKSTVTDKSMKEIVAFANTSGGTIYYGVDDSGKVIGLKYPNKMVRNISG